MYWFSNFRKLSLTSKIFFGNYQKISLEDAVYSYFIFFYMKYVENRALKIRKKVVDNPAC